MRGKRNKSSAALPLMLLRLAMDAGETMGRRYWMMASGKCSPAEYQRMVLEKVKATQQTGIAMLSGHTSLAGLLRPWSMGTRRNVKRLRKR